MISAPLRRVWYTVITRMESNDPGWRWRLLGTSNVMATYCGARDNLLTPAMIEARLTSEDEDQAAWQRDLWTLARGEPLLTT